MGDTLKLTTICYLYIAKIGSQSTEYCSKIRRKTYDKAHRKVEIVKIINIIDVIRCHNVTSSISSKELEVFTIS